jgi:mycothiol synthase
MENSTINPVPPLLPGLTWRAITRDDLGALVELAADCHLADGGLAFLNEPNNLRERYFPDAPGRGIGACAADDKLIACTTVHLTRQSDVQRAIIVGQVRPEWRNQGLGSYLMRWSQVQAQTLLSTATADQRVLRIATESLTESANHLYRAHGFESVFEELVMQRDLRMPLPEGPLPPDVSLTTWQPALADQFFQAYTAAFRDRPGFPGTPATEWISDLTEDENFKPEWSLLARIGELPVGFVNAAAERPGGFVVQIGVIPGQRRRGLASALIVETMRRMQAAGMSSTQLAVNINNPGAIQTYAGLGFVTIGRRARYEQTTGRLFSAGILSTEDI